MHQFVSQHQFWTAVAAYWIFSAAVSSMPDPPAGASPVYSWLFRFCHTMAGNITTVFGNKIPGAKTAMLLLVLPLALSAPACARYVVHSGAVNTTDSAAYDTLLVAQTMIDQARADYATGDLPGGTRDAFNTLVRAYNVARESWLTFRTAVSADPADQTYYNRLNQNLVDLTAAIRAFQEVQ